MTEKNEILLKSHWTNKLKLDSGLAWMIREDRSASTGYNWQFIPDKSGVYELAEVVTLEASVDAPGVPGVIIWKIKPLLKGTGTFWLELYPPGGDGPVEKVIITVEVS